VMGFITDYGSLRVFAAHYNRTSYHLGSVGSFSDEEEFILGGGAG
jgi:hypothetical protein